VPHPDECLGYRTCEDGAWSDCAPLDHEICNEIDDDCDGEVDEGVLNACGSCDPRCTPPPKDVVQPVVSCFERGRESDALCALPPSECHGQWIVYWTNGRCMNRFCVYDYGVDWCDDWCIGGACMVPFT
jgi:hypothetical protein